MKLLVVSHITEELSQMHIITSYHVRGQVIYIQDIVTKAEDGMSLGGQREAANLPYHLQHSQ